MKTSLLAFLVFVTILASERGQEVANSARRVSIAEVGTVRLEVEQPTYKNEVRIRVRDCAARNRQKQSVSCDIYYVGDDGREGKIIQTVTFKQVSPASDDYSGSSSDRKEFEHGNIVRVVYKSDGLRLPICTWYAFYYH